MHAADHHRRDEEYGGSFEEFPPEHPAMFAADAIVIADTGNVRVGQPTFTSALRGMGMVEVKVETLEAPVHSGLFGGPAPDALMVLIGCSPPFATTTATPSWPG